MSSNQIGMVGLGRMGMNMARRLLKGKHEVVVYNRTHDKVVQMEAEGAIGTGSLEELGQKLSPPRVVWMMLPAGKPIDEAIKKLSNILSTGDLIVDGGNSYYKDDLRRSREVKPCLRYVDAGVSGGIWGLEQGYCLMIGGAREDFRQIEPFLKTLAPENGYLYCGPTGAGHFVKMVHNGIEYALMQAYAEGFELLRASPYAEQLRLEQIARLWTQGSVIRSWLLELLASALAKDPELSSIAGYVEDSGEGRWNLQQAIESGVPATAMAYSLFQRFQSRQEESFANKIIAALRREFGGHAVFVKETKSSAEA